MVHAQVQNLANHVNELWDIWNLRVCLMMSLCLQAFLMLIASLRKRCKSNFLHLWIWSAYLLADWIAAYALGQTVQSPGDKIYDPKKSGDLYIFWAQFLLLHLAGPDSITSFSPGDSGVWLRSLFGLLCQVVATIYSFFLLALARKNKLWIPTILVFAVGLIKSYERVKALLNAGFDRFGETLLPKPDPGRDYEDAVLTYRSMRGVQVEMQPDKKIRPINHSYHDLSLREVDHDDIELLCAAHSFFEDFKVLFTGSFLSFQSRETSRDYFLQCSHSNAFRLVEYELSFLHDLMHTKMVVLHNMYGYIRRIVCFSSISAASILFFLTDKHGYTKFDVNLTHALLLGTISFDIISLIKLIFSEWCIIRSPWIRHLIPACILRRKRWSRSVFQYNMFKYCLSKHQTRVFYRLASHMFNSAGFMEKLRAMWYSSLETVTKNFEEFIFKELKKKSSNDLKAAKEACSQRGLLALLKNSCYTKLEWSIKEFQYLESLLLWHLATELCYHNLNKDQIKIDQDVKFSQLLSNYMFYLLVVQPTMLSQEMGNLSIVLQDTQAEAIKFFKKHSISHHKEACKKLNSIETPYRPASVKGSKSKSLLFDACILAKQLHNLQELQWQVMAQVWIELMSYAAINCSPATHAQQPSRGGELLTFTWLLMYHLGLGTQFSEQVPHG